MKRIEVLKVNNSSLVKFSKIVPFIIISAASFCVYYLLNRNTPPYYDDIFLKFVFNGWFGNGKITAPRVTNIGQILEGMTQYYRIFRGRVIAEGLDQLFAVYGKQYFNILNAVVFTGITFLVYFHSNYGKKANWILYLFVCVMFWFLTPDFMATTLWMVGCLCECWPVFFVLLFLVPYRMLVSQKCGVKHPVFSLLFLIPIGFLAGAFNEQSFGLSIGFSSLAIIWTMIKKRKVPLWSIVGLLFTIGGTMFVLMAPGNKFESIKSYGMPPLSLYFKSFPNNVFRAVSMSFEVIIVFLILILIVLLWFNMNRKRSTNKYIKQGNEARHKSFKKLSFGNNYELFLLILFLSSVIGAIVIAIVVPYYYKSFFKVFVFFELVLIIVSASFFICWNYRNRRDNQVYFSRKRTNIKQSIISLKSRILIPVIFLIATVNSVVIATALPYVEYRLFFTVFVSSALTFFSLLSEAIDHYLEIQKECQKSIFSKKYLILALPVLLSLVTLFDFGKEYRVYHREFIVYTDFVSFIEKKVASGERNIVLPQKSEVQVRLLKGGRLHGFFFAWAFIINDENIFANNWYAYSFGADSITNAVLTTETTPY